MSITTSWMLTDNWVQLYLYWFKAAGSVHSVRDVLKSSTIKSVLICFSLQYQFLPHVFWCFVVRHVHIKDSYIFLKYCYLYHCVIPSSSLITFLLLKSEVSENNRTTTAFFWLVLAGYIFLHSFTFHLYVFICKVDFL